MALLDPSDTVELFDRIVCGPYVGLLYRRGRTMSSILTARDLIEVPNETPMRPVIREDLAKLVLNALCREGEEGVSMPIWAKVWDERDVLISELASALGKSERVIRAAIKRKDPVAQAPNNPWLLAGYEYIGPFRVDQGLIIADRCYVNRDHVLLAVRTSALAGTWHAYFRYDPNFEMRNVAILVVHENHFDLAKANGEELGSFGVDAGCAVVVDQRVLADADLVHALTETSEWDEGLIRDIGCFAHTYDGDGMYSVRAIRKDDQVVAIRVNVTRDEQYDYHTPPPSDHYTDSLNKAMETAGPAKPYATTATFVAGDRVMHKKFGEGLVTKIIDAGKVEIAFPEGVKTLVHGQKK